MRAPALALCFLLLAGPAAAAGEPVATPVGTFTTTNSGQPILLPRGPAQVTVTRVEIPAGASLPVHKHPHPRYAWVLEGRIRVTNLDTGGAVEYGPGGVIIEARGQWHTGTALGTEPVRLLVIDQTPPGEANTVRRD
jgi:quercetin dioxygenase-like cupin family protein